MTVDVSIPPLGAQQILPTIQVKAGQWNLVPVISLLPLGAGRDEVQNRAELDADDYLGAATAWTRAFTFNKGRWISVRQGVAPQCDASAPAEAVAAGLIGPCGGTLILSELAVNADVDNADGDDDTTTGISVLALFDVSFNGAATPNSLDDAVQIGRGYWVFYTTDSTITP